jgi:hypothetical protein
MANGIKYALISLFLFSFSTSAQTFDNLQFLLSLTDSSVSLIAGDLEDGKSYFLKTVNPQEYATLAERARFAFSRAGVNVTNDSISSNVIGYNIENAKIEYPDIFRDGWFGDYLIERRAELNGYYITKTNGRTETAKPFAIIKTDTIAYDKIKQYELASLPFTQSSVPAEPFFSSLWEPIIAVGAVVVTVVLLFTTRTK